MAFSTNPDIAAALFIQGGEYTTHEIQLMREAGKHVVCFWGSGGASGGEIPYNDWSNTLNPEGPQRSYHSKDPNMSPELIALELVEDLMAGLK